MMYKKSSLVSKFYKKSRQERLDILKEFSNLSGREISLLENLSALNFNSANMMAENVVSTIQIPLGIATNFIVNNNDYLIPMATEEPSVIAAASCAAKFARNSGGFFTQSSKPIAIGQIQIKEIKDFDVVIKKINQNKQVLIDLANKQDPILIGLGGGVQDLHIRTIKNSRSRMLIIHLIVNVQDAMGANIVNTMAEKISPMLEKITGGKVGLRIISNLSLYRISKAKAIWKKEDITNQVIEDIIDAYEFAQVDPFRSATHNKGIMNGIDAVAIATGNDFRAIEAGAHAFAAFEQKYSPLTKYYKNQNGDLVGEIKIPISVGIVGGITQLHPIAKICLKILNVKTSSDLANIMSSVGLAQNFAALKALVTTGIQSGHMKLNSKNIAVTAGATKKIINLMSEQMCNENNISIHRAKELIDYYAK